MQNCELLKGRVFVKQSLSHKKHNRFFNPFRQDSKRSLFDVLLWQLGYYDDDVEGLTSSSIEGGNPWQNIQDQNTQEDTNHVYAKWINHSTFLIAVDSLFFLTDPIWSMRASPNSMLGPKRKIEAGVQLSDLPQVNFVLISHNHYDHLDKKSIEALHKKFPNIVFFVPLQVKNWFLRRGITQVIEMDWWEQTEILVDDEMKIVVTSVPSQHFSGRGLFDRDKSLWCGWVCEFYKKDHLVKKFYFVGDTGYNSEDFRDIGVTLGPMDLSLIPIGAYLPRAFMSPVHISPQEALLIHQDVKSKMSLACHFGTFKLSDESLQRPGLELYEALMRQKIPLNSFKLPKPGQLYTW